VNHREDYGEIACVLSDAKQRSYGNQKGLKEGEDDVSNTDIFQFWLFYA